jgi:hypothetical protein
MRHYTKTITVLLPFLAAARLGSHFTTVLFIHVAVSTRVTDAWDNGDCILVLRDLKTTPNSAEVLRG